jgi:hypothetical protein
MRPRSVANQGNFHSVVVLIVVVWLKSSWQQAPASLNEKAALALSRSPVIWTSPSIPTSQRGSTRQL